MVPSIILSALVSLAVFHLFHAAIRAIVVSLYHAEYNHEWDIVQGRFEASMIRKIWAHFVTVL